MVVHLISRHVTKEPTHFRQSRLLSEAALIQIDGCNLNSEQVYDMDVLSSSAISSKMEKQKYPLSMLWRYHTCLCKSFDTHE